MTQSNSQRQMPLAILRETYRPIAFFLGEMLLAAAFFLPANTQTWAQKLIQLDAAQPDKPDADFQRD